MNQIGTPEILPENRWDIPQESLQRFCSGMSSGKYKGFFLAAIRDLIDFIET